MTYSVGSVDSGDEGWLRDDGLGPSPNGPRIAEVPMLASLYVQPICPAGTFAGNGATAFMVRGHEGRPFLITNRHVVTAQNSLDNLQVIGGGLAPAALRVAVHAEGRWGTWLRLAVPLADDSAL